MVTSMTMPNNIYEEANILAKRLKLTNNHLFVLATKEFIELHKTDEVTKELDKVYQTNNSGVDDVLSKLQSQIIKESEQNETW